MFKQSFELLQDGQILNITILKKGEKLTICALPDSKLVNESVKSKLMPLSVTGTPEELDKGFWSVFAANIPKAVGLISNAEQFSKSIEKADLDIQREGSKNASAQKGKINSKVQKQFEEAENLEKRGRIPEALILYRKIFEADKTNKKAEAKVFELDGILRQKSLFTPTDMLNVDQDNSDSDDNDGIQAEEDDNAYSFDAMDELEKLNEQAKPGQIKENEVKKAVLNNPPSTVDQFAELLGKGNTNGLTTIVIPGKTSVEDAAQEAKSMAAEAPAFDADMYQKFLQFQQMQQEYQTINQ